MAKKLGLLVDTDIFIDHFNHQLFRELFESGKFSIYYSVVTRKELLSKEGLQDTERKSIQKFLKKCRLVPFDRAILRKYSDLRQHYPQSAKEDALFPSWSPVPRQAPGGCCPCHGPGSIVQKQAITR